MDVVLSKICLVGQYVSLNERVCGKWLAIPTYEEMGERLKVPQTVALVERWNREDSVWRRYGFPKLPNWIQAYCCAQFMVTAERLRKHPVEFYTELYNNMFGDDSGCLGRNGDEEQCAIKNGVGHGAFE